ncbi:MAG: fused MFS/spermidine synthase, partial [Pseudomonadota bacterium]
MNKRLAFSFLVLGFVSIVAQVVIQRELINGFYGNEFFIGVVLASWFIWTAAGSGIKGLSFPRKRESLEDTGSPIKALGDDKRNASGKHLPPLFIAIGFVFLAEIFLIRLLNIYVGLPGETPNLICGVLIALAAPAPICLMLGMWWTQGTRTLCGQTPSAETEGGAAAAVNRAYLIELAGFIVGGILFSFVLVRLQEFMVAGILILLSLGSAILFTLKLRFSLRAVAAFLLVVVACLMFSHYPGAIDRFTTAFRYRGQEVTESRNSRYGNIAVTKIGTQSNFYENGVLFGSTEKVEFIEDLIHLSLLEHPSPGRVLLIGGGFTGAINEILKHPVEEVDYLEIDPELIRIARRHIPPEFEKALSDPRVKIINADGRYFLKNEKGAFDAIIVNLPAPSTALIDRFYTKDFYEAVKGRLNPGGILAACLPFSSSAPGRNMEDLNASIFKTLKEVFGRVIVLPEDIDFFLASTDQELTYDPKVLVERFEERGIEASFVHPAYIKYRLTTDRIEKALSSFGKNTTARVNEDFLPVAYFYQNLAWLDQFHPGYSGFFKIVASHFLAIFAGIAALLAIFLMATRRDLTSVAPILSIA